MSLQISSKFLNGASLKDDGEQYSTATFSESDSSKERILKSRCQSEKKRRDKLNLLISELRSILCPGVTSQKYDKATVLQMTVEYMKIHNDMSGGGNTENLKKSFFLPCEELGNLMLQTLNGFILVIDEEFKFLYVADAVQQVLGVKPRLLEGKPVTSLVHQDDHKNLLGILKTVLSTKTRLNRSSSKIAAKDKNEKMLEKVNFRILVTNEKCEPEYRTLKCVGKCSDFQKTDENSPNKNVLFLMACLEMEEVHEVGSDLNSIVLMFHSKHSLDGRFLDTDSSCPSLTGYLPNELCGRSLYEFVHDDDISDVVTVHKQVTSSNSTEVVQVFFRFLSKGKDWPLFKVQCQLVVKSNMQSPCIRMCFKLARGNEIFHFRHFAKSKSVQMVNVMNIDSDKTSSVNQGDAPPKKFWKNDQEEKSDVDSYEKGDNLGEKLWSDGSPSKSNLSPPVETSDGTGLAEDDDTHKNVEEIFDAQKHLHEQLEEKHAMLSESLKKQKAQMETIGKTMNEYAYFMEAPSFKNHYKQQVEMLEYFQYVFKKQQRQQEYLQKQLKGKIKELEIKQRAVKLRNIATQQQKTLSWMKEMRAEQQQKKSSCFHPTIFTMSKTSDIVCASSPTTTSSTLNIAQNSPVMSHQHKQQDRRGSAPETQQQAVPTDMSFLELLNEPKNRHAQTEQDHSSVHISTKNIGYETDASIRTVQRQSNASRINSFRNSFDNVSNNFMSSNHTGTNSASCSRKELDTLYSNHKHSPQSSSSTPFFHLPQLPNPSSLIANQQMLLNSLTSLTQQGMNQQIEFISNNNTAASNKLVETGSEGNNIQNELSNLILVHLQELQKHVLSQLQAVDHSKMKENDTDLSQILPVLQQLQQLQASIIEQQTQNHSSRGQTEQLQTSSSSSFATETAIQQEPHYQSRVMNDINKQNMLRRHNLIHQNNTNISQSFGRKSSDVPSDSVFGDLNARRKELNQIKERISYKKETPSENEFSDCFSNISSPELRSLMFGDTNDMDTINDNNRGDNDVKEKKSLEEDNTLQYFQPLLEDQQQLAQLLQYQRLQILNQQHHVLNSFQTVELPGQMDEQREQTVNTFTDNANAVDFSALPPNIAPFNFTNDSGELDPGELVTADNETLNILLNENDIFW